MNDKRIWTIGAVILAVAIVLGGYFLGVSPQLAAASDADQERAGIEQQNAALAAELAVLEKDYESIGDFKSELATLRVAVPSNAQYSAFVTELDALAVAAGVQVSSMTVAAPLPYAGPMNAAALMLPTGALHELSDALMTAATTGDAADAAAAAELDDALKRPIMDPVESSLVTPSNFVAIPVTIEAKGEYQRLLDFTSSVQNGSRLTLVYALSLKPKEEQADGEGAAAAEAASPYTATMSGYIYVLLKPSDIPVDLAAVAAAEAETKAAEDAAAAE